MISELSLASGVYRQHDAEGVTPGFQKTSFFGRRYSSKNGIAVGKPAKALNNVVMLVGVIQRGLCSLLVGLKAPPS